MSESMQSILDNTRKLIQQKQASFKSNVGGLPKAAAGLDTAGAKDERDAKTLTATEPALTPKSEPAITADAKAEPASTSGSTGSHKAEGKKDTTETGAQTVLDALQPSTVAKADEKPLLTADAKAEPKSAAAKLANEIIRDIRAVQTAKPVAKQAEETMAEEKKEEGKKVMPSKKHEAGETKAEEKKEEEAKAASGLNLELDRDVLAKIAASLLSTEEGAQVVEAHLAKVAGAESAQEILHFMAAQSEAAEKQAAYEAGSADAQALINQMIYEEGLKAGQATKTAADEQAMFEKLGQEVADSSISDIMGQGAAGMPGAEGAAGAEGGAEGGEISSEELAQALEALVSEGTLKPEEAQQIMEYVAQEEQGGAAAGGAMPPEAAGAEAAAEPEAKEPKKEEPKEASAPQTKAANLLETIRKLRAAK